MKRTCRCGGTRFTFIGNQYGTHNAEYFLKLFNCLKCGTTVAEKVFVKPDRFLVAQSQKQL